VSRDTQKPKLSRRKLLQLGGATAAVGIGAAALLDDSEAPEAGLRAATFVGRLVDYETDARDLIRRGLAEVGVAEREVRGMRVLLKPNLVETSRDHPHINTHPSLVVAAAEVFRSLGAADVRVGEGQGHRRDSRLVLDESGMGTALREARLDFVDLNHDDPVEVPNAGEHTDFRTLWLPRTIIDADLVVSMPKVKTHHWAGVTCAMKNLFGVMPGIIYGWPKNPLHQKGIANSILDIHATVGASLAIVDGVVAMEGDGPIMGAPKDLGAVLIGRNPVAVDATATRLMGLTPESISYLAAASGLYGPILAGHIDQRGEAIDEVAQSFEVLELPHLANLARG